MGHRVRQARDAKHITQEKLAAAVHKKKALISAIERGVTAPSAEVLIGLGSILGTGVDALIYGPDARTSQSLHLPGTSIEERVSALPAAMREAVLQTLRKCEIASKAVPAQFLTPPSGDDLEQFMNLLERLSKTLPPTTQEREK